MAILKFTPKLSHLRLPKTICYRCDCPIEDSDVQDSEGKIDNHNLDIRKISGNGIVSDITELTHKECPAGRRKF